MEKTPNVFSSIQPYKEFVLKHGTICKEVWKRRLMDDKPYRVVYFEDFCKAIAIHQLDGLTIEELTNLSSLKVGHFIEGGYAIFMSWVDPWGWEDVDLNLKNKKQHERNT